MRDTTWQAVISPIGRIPGREMGVGV